MKRIGLLILIAALLVGCNRRIEPYVEGEKPSQPDMSAIFPPGAEKAAQAAPTMPPAPGGRRGAPPVAASGKPIRGTITLAPELAGRVPPGGVLFLIARAGAGGPPMAVKRVANPEFPLDFVLGPEDRMMDTMPFAGPVRITARVDSDGNASTKTPGDLDGAASGEFNPGDSGVAVVLSRVFEGQAPVASAPAAPSAPAATGDAAAIQGEISLSPELAGSVPSGAVLFLIARTAERGPPLAVQRVTDPSFPMAFSIGPADRMIQSMPFAGEIRISARLDGDGNAMSRNPGDLSGSSPTAHAPGDTGVAVVIDQVL